MIATTGVTAAIITATAGVLAGVVASSRPSQPVPIRVKVRRRVRAIRRN